MSYSQQRFARARITVHDRGHVIARARSFAAITFSSSIISRLTDMCRTPLAIGGGDSKVDSSRIVAGSKTATSAKRPRADHPPRIDDALHALVREARCDACDAAAADRDVG